MRGRKRRIDMRIEVLDARVIMRDVVQSRFHERPLFFQAPKLTLAVISAIYISDTGEGGKIHNRFMHMGWCPCREQGREQ